jgi:hypothetical protein
MSFVDVAIPGVIGLVLVMRPQVVFVGSRVTPDAKRIRLLRRVGVLLLVVALIYLVIKLAGT